MLGRPRRPHAVLLPVITHVPLYSFLTLISSSGTAGIFPLDVGSCLGREDEPDRLPEESIRHGLVKPPDDNFRVCKAVGRVEFAAWIGIEKNLKLVFRFKDIGIAQPTRVAIS